MIAPGNTRLKKFHLLVSVSCYMDFIWTSFCLGNYDFQMGRHDGFMDHERIFAYICTIQYLDIVLTFFKT